MTKFRQFEKYPTRNGGTALILTTPQRNGDGIVAAHYAPNGDWAGQRVHYENGAVMGGSGHAALHAFDILPPEPETRGDPAAVDLTVARFDEARRLASEIDQLLATANERAGRLRELGCFVELDHTSDDRWGLMDVGVYLRATDAESE